jgi:hypothetical protein
MPSRGWSSFRQGLLDPVTRKAAFEIRSFVGWVERSETHRYEDVMGFAALNPSWQKSIALTWHTDRIDQRDGRRLTPSPTTP